MVQLDDVVTDPSNGQGKGPGFAGLIKEADTGVQQILCGDRCFIQFAHDHYEHDGFVYIVDSETDEVIEIPTALSRF